MLLAPVLVCHVFRGCTRRKKAWYFARPVPLDIFLRPRLPRDALNARKVDFPVLTARDRALIATAALLPTSPVYLSATIVQRVRLRRRVIPGVTNVLSGTCHYRVHRNANLVQGGNILMGMRCPRGKDASGANAVGFRAARHRAHVMHARKGNTLARLVCLHVSDVPVDASPILKKL